MEFFTTFDIIGSGLSAQRKKMDVVTSNIANASTTSTPEGGPYKRKVNQVREDAEGFKKIFDPAHPDADPEGMVTLPNVNLMLEMTDLITASRAYEANATAFDAIKNMALKAMEIGK